MKEKEKTRENTILLLEQGLIKYGWQFGFGKEISCAAEGKWKRILLDGALLIQ